MFRIPDYVAGTRADGVSQQAALADRDGGRRAVTRLDPPSAAPIRRQPDAGAQTGEAATPQRPPGAEERQLTAHMARSRVEATSFAAESRFLQAQAEADAAEEDARAEAGPAGAGFTGIVARNLALLKETLLADLPAYAADDLRAAIEARFDEEAERRLDRAATEEVRTGHAATREKLAEMQADLLERIVREPDRTEALAAQGERFTAVNILPAEERAGRLADWRARVAQVRDGAAVDLPSSEVSRSAIETSAIEADETSVGAMERAAAPQSQTSFQSAVLNSDSSKRILAEPSSERIPLPVIEDPDRSLLGQFGRMTEAQARAEVTSNEAAAIETAAEALERAERLKRLKALDLGYNPVIEAVAEKQRREDELLPLHLRQTRQGTFARAAGEAMHARDQLSGNERLPRYSKFRNSIDRFVTGLASLGPDAVKAMGIVGSLVPGISDDNALMRAADSAEQTIRAAFPGDPARADEFLSGLASGSGSMASLLIGNVVIRTLAGLAGASARAASLAGTVGTAGLGAAVQGVQGFEDAQRMGADQLARYTAFFLNAGLGTSDAVPIDRFFGRLNRLTGNRVGEVLQTTKAQSLEEFTQEVVQSLGSDIIAKAVYDPDRNVDLPAVLSDGIVGAIIGGAMGAGALSRNRARRISDESPPTGPITRYRAQFELAQFRRNADRIFKSATAEAYFKPVWKNLPPHMQNFLEQRYRNFAGTSGAKIVTERLEKARFHRNQNTNYTLPPGVGRSARIYDEATSEELKLGLLDLLIVPGERMAKPIGIEAKVASSRVTRDQSKADDYLRGDGEAVAGVEVLRVPAHRIKPAHLAEVLDEWLANRSGQARPGGVPRKDIDDLVRQLREYRGPDGKLLTIGQVSLVVLATTLPLVYPSETGEAEQP